MRKTPGTTSIGFRLVGINKRLQAAARRHGPRTFWGLMAIAHAPALTSCWHKLATVGLSAGGVESCLLLLAAMIFFLLKVFDARALRFRVTRQSMVAFCVIIAFFHFDAIRTNGDSTLMPEYTSLIVTTTLLCRSVTMRRDLAISGSRKRSPTSLSPKSRPLESIWMDAFRPPCWTRPMHVYALRAPPV